MFYKSNVCPKDHILLYLNILPYFLDRGVIWTSPKHKSLVQSISSESQFWNCKHRLPMSLLPQKVWNSKNAHPKNLRIEKWCLHHQGSLDVTEMNHVIQPPHSQQCESQEIHSAARWMAPTPTGRCSYKNPCLTYSNGILCSRCFTAEAHLTPILLCFFTAMGFFKVSYSTEFTNDVKTEKSLTACSPSQRPTLYDVIEVNEKTLSQVFVLPHVSNKLFPSKHKYVFFFFMKIWSFFFQNNSMTKQNLSMRWHLSVLI